MEESTQVNWDKVPMYNYGYNWTFTDELKII